MPRRPPPPNPRPFSHRPLISPYPTSSTPEIPRVGRGAQRATSPGIWPGNRQSPRIPPSSDPELPSPSPVALLKSRHPLQLDAESVSKASSSRFALTDPRRPIPVARFGGNCRLGSVLLFSAWITVAALNRLLRPTPNGCQMTYMYPTYIPIPTPQNVSPTGTASSSTTRARSRSTSTTTSGSSTACRCYSSPAMHSRVRVRGRRLQARPQSIPRARPPLRPCPRLRFCQRRLRARTSLRVRPQHTNSTAATPMPRPSPPQPPSSPSPPTSL